ncbi:hypothetical protein M422DRAFT_165874 [Sphaerobolus stellatus SS14]|uniref:Glutathione synthetase n=1 Tax=Sphaerobolus stellatus (strain SS14) TaxID=990650 RepID=A0A0C9VG52_SPHS4|nr:hypothetical protein M422DRAFT_165874 [Sphaerobolus stellatus SS14]
MDDGFLDKVMGAEEGVGKSDDFVGTLWKGWKKYGVSQKLQLGLFRSDYLLHEDKDTHEISIKQVEFNTISSSFGALSYRAAAMHRYLLASTGYYGSSPLLNGTNLPPNNTLPGLVEGLAAAHKAYGQAETQILFVVQDGERNVFDQRWLEYELLENHGILVVRQTFDQLAISASISADNKLIITLPNQSIPIEISVVYFRAGYTPTDYPTPDQYETRFLLNRSRAIQCPSIALQLAGGKKVQEVLSRPGVVESFLLYESKGPERFTEEDVKEIRSSWMGMWSLDLNGDEGVRKAREDASNLVLKPQREGGGNNVYKESIPEFLDGLKNADREAWIAMELIRPPEGIHNWLVRAGGGSAGRVKADVVSELGIFGWALFGEGPTVQKDAGWLVRTKGRESNEGGVAVGFSVLDSLVLLDA